MCHFKMGQEFPQVLTKTLFYKEATQTATPNIVAGTKTQKSRSLALFLPEIWPEIQKKYRNPEIHPETIIY